MIGYLNAAVRFQPTLARKREFEVLNSYIIYRGSLARIDLLGRYESLFDSSLCSNTDLQSSRSGLKKMLNRYVKQPPVQEDSNSYEAAMQIVENVKRMVSRSQSSGVSI